MAKESKSLRDGNGRVARLARWLQTPPEATNVDLLALEHKEDGEWKRLQCWSREHVNQALASQIDAVVTDLANELGCFVIGRVVWMISGTQSYWTEHALRVQPEDMDVAQAFSGDAQSIAIQNQRHQEKIVTTHINGFGSAIQALRETNGDLRDANRITSAENVRLREELNNTRMQLVDQQAENARLQQMLEEALSAAEKSAERADENETEGNVIKLITQAASAAMAPAPRAG